MHFGKARELANQYGIEFDGTRTRSFRGAVSVFSKMKRKYGSCWLKFDSPIEAATHKSEHGYVKKINSVFDLMREWRKMKATATSKGHLSEDGKPVDWSFVLMPHYSKGHEVLVGARKGSYGPVVSLKVGGTLVDLIPESQNRIGPVTSEQALEMINSHSALGNLFSGYRGSEIVSERAKTKLADFISRVSKMAADPRVKEIDFNPVKVSADGLSLADVRVIAASEEERRESQRLSAEPVLSNEQLLAKFNPLFEPKKVVIVGASTSDNLTNDIAKNVYATLGARVGAENIYLVNRTNPQAVADRLGV